MSETVRIDKWLWAVRLFKTRTQASEACRDGKVKLASRPVKPSHEVKAGEEITIQQPAFTRTVKVLALLHNRVGAVLVPQFMADLTPESEYQRVKMMREVNFEYRDPGSGRPTKRQRREIETLKKYLGDETGPDGRSF
jgi:ribosome-associated heat shock protein Hsp15